MVRVDLHVHTRRYSPCAEGLDPAALPGIMRARGLAGLVISEHDAVWSAAELGALRAALGPGQRVYAGVEVTTREGHLVVIGLADLGGIRRGIAGAALVERALREGAAVILAHPQRGRAGPYEHVLPGLHAIEVRSTSTLGDHAARAAALARTLGLPAVAGSDAHALEQVGAVATAFHRLPEDETALAAMIRSGQGLPCSCPADARSCRCSSS